MLWATCGGLGYLPAPGTVASIAALIVRLWSVAPGYLLYELPIVMVVYAFSFYVSYWAVKQGPEKDPSYIVIDEFMAQWTVSLLVPLALPYQVAGLIVFRFFDISKYGFLSDVEQLPTPHAVMLDDLLAAVWAIGITWGIYFSGLL